MGETEEGRKRVVTLTYLRQYIGNDNGRVVRVTVGSNTWYIVKRINNI